MSPAHFQNRLAASAAALRAHRRNPAALQGDQIVLIVPHALELHILKLAQAAAGLDAFHKVAPLRFGQRINHVHRSLIDSQNIRRGNDPQIRRGGCRRAKPGAVAIHRQVPKYVDIGNMLPKMIGNGFAAFHHPFHEQRASGPAPVAGKLMDLLLAQLP